MNVEIEIAQTAKYNDYYNKNTHLVEFFAESLVRPIAKFYSGLPEEVKIVIRPIKAGRNFITYGRSVGYSTIELDCRANNCWKIADTIAHEFCHMQQKALGKLEFDYSGNKTQRAWTDESGQKILFPVKDRNFQEYQALPWEVEARQKAAEFVEENTWYIHQLTLDVLGVKSYEERKRKW